MTVSQEAIEEADQTPSTSELNDGKKFNFFILLMLRCSHAKLCIRYYWIIPGTNTKISCH